MRGTIEPFALWCNTMCEFIENAHPQVAAQMAWKAAMQQMLAIVGDAHGWLDSALISHADQDCECRRDEVIGAFRILSFAYSELQREIHTTTGLSRQQREQRAQRRRQ